MLMYISGNIPIIQGKLSALGSSIIQKLREPTGRFSKLGLALSTILLIICCPAVQAQDDSPEIDGLPAFEEIGLPEDTAENFPDTNNFIPSESDSVLTRIEESLSMSGTAKTGFSYRVQKPHEFTGLEHQIWIKEAAELSDVTHFSASQRVVYDSIFDVTDHYPTTVAKDERKLTELHELYIDYSASDFDFRAGRYQTVWGEAVGLFFADVVNAKDLRTFILPPFDEIRIPDWGATVEYAKNDFHLELLFIPCPEFDKTAVKGAEFEFGRNDTSGIPIVEMPYSTPDNKLRNGQFGSRGSYLVNGWDLTGFYLNTWDKSPVRFRSVTSNESVFTPEFKRLNVFGATFSKALADAVIKSEFVFNRGAYFSTTNPNDSDGVQRTNYADYLVGADKTLFDRYDFNFQLMQRAFSSHDDDLFLNGQRVRTLVSVRLAGKFLDDDLEPEVLLITDVAQHDLMVRPKVSYKIAPDVRVSTGLDYFSGTNNGLFGQFDGRSRAYGEVAYSF